MPPIDREPNWPDGTSRLMLFAPTKSCAIEMMVPFSDCPPWWYAACSDTYPEN